MLVEQVLCGRITPEQKTIVRRQAEMDTDLFMDHLTWFIKESGHQGYSEVTPPDECPNPVIILQEGDNENTTDDPVDPILKCEIQGKTYFFSNKAQNPKQDNSVFDNTEDFVEAMLTSNAPTMLIYSGNYLKGHKMNLEDMFLIQFPFGSGGPMLGKIEKLMCPMKHIYVTT